MNNVALGPGNTGKEGVMKELSIFEAECLRLGNFGYDSDLERDVVRSDSSERGESHVSEGARSSSDH